MERSSRVLTLIFPRTSIFPPRCMRNVRSETLTTFTPWTARIPSTTCWPCGSSRALNVMSRVIVVLPTTTRAMAPMSPPASPRGDPYAQARRGDSRDGQAAGARLQDAQHELPGHRHGAAIRLDDRAHPGGPHLLPRHRGARLRNTDAPAQLRDAVRGHV